MEYMRRLEEEAEKIRKAREEARPLADKAAEAMGVARDENAYKLILDAAVKVTEAKRRAGEEYEKARDSYERGSEKDS